jgi:hypothetical protein
MKILTRFLRLFYFLSAMGFLKYSSCNQLSVVVFLQKTVSQSSKESYTQDFELVASNLLFPRSNKHLNFFI